MTQLSMFGATKPVRLTVAAALHRGACLTDRMYAGARPPYAVMVPTRAHAERIEFGVRAVYLGGGPTE